MTDAPSRLVLIRHGQSRSNLEEWISSQDTCGGLTDLGRAEAAAARDRLAGMPELAPDTIVVSTMRRAIETAAIVSEPTGMAAEQRAELMERQPGEVEGMTVVDFVEQFGEKPYLQWEPAVSAGGEDAVTFQGRVAGALDRLAGETQGKTTWVVCHGWVITSTAHHFAGGDVGVEPNFIGPANCALGVWTQDTVGERWRMERYNDHAHTVSLLDGSAGSFL